MQKIKKVDNHFFKECYFTVGNLVLLQCICIPVGNDPAPFWANLYLYDYEDNFIFNLIKPINLEPPILRKPLTSLMMNVI